MQKNDILNHWVPKSLIELRFYSKRKLLTDLLAGATVALIALPLSIGFAIASGVPPQTGLCCAIGTGFLISALGGSTTQIGGLAGIFVVLVHSILVKDGIGGLFMCTLMSGVILVLLGATGLGTAMKFLPKPIIVGFMNGTAAVIASTQIKDFFGLKIDHVPDEFWARIKTLARSFYAVSVEATTVAIIALLVILLCLRYMKRMPGYFVAFFIGTALVAIFKLRVETIGLRFGGIPSGLPPFKLPDFRLELLRSLLSPAIAIAMLGAIESLRSAVGSDRVSVGKLNLNANLVHQGIANILSPLFGGLPTTGSISRAVPYMSSSAKTPLAELLCALTLLALVLLAAPLARFIPLCVLAAILLVASYNMGEWKEIPQVLKLPRLDIGVWLTTFLITVFLDLTVAVQTGMTMAALLMIRNVITTPPGSLATEEYVGKWRAQLVRIRFVRYRLKQEIQCPQYRLRSETSI